MRYDPSVVKASDIANAITDLGFPTNVINDQDCSETEVEIIVRFCSKALEEFVKKKMVVL